MDIALSALGVVSAAGIGARALQSALEAGRSCMGCAVFPEISPEPFPVGRCGDLKSVPGEDRALTLARAALRECVAGVGAGLGALTPGRLGLVVGTTCGGVLSLEAASGGDGGDGGSQRAAAGGGPAEALTFDAVTRALAERLPGVGPTRTLTVACASGTQIFEVARGLLRSGEVDGVLLGAVDTVSAFILRGFGALRGLGRLPYGVFRPEGAGEGGGVILAEGAAFFYMEPREVALRGGRRPLARLLGCASGNEGHALTRPRADGAGIARALQAAIADAGLGPEAVGHVNLHGTGTLAGDRAEVAGLKTVFGPRWASLGYSATKPILGHASGAAGALEVAGLLLAAQGGFLPALANAEAMTLPIPLGAARRGAVGIAASLGAGFAGSNAAVILDCRPDGARGGVTATRRRRWGAGGPLWITAIGSALPEGTGADALPGAPLKTPAPGSAAAGPWMRALGEVPLSRESQRMDPLCAGMVLAAMRCLGRGGAPAGARLGLSAGSALGCLESSAAFIGGRRANPVVFQNTVCNATLAYLAMATGALGPASMVTQGPLSGVVALAEGRRMLEEGACDGVLVVAGDRPLPPALVGLKGGDAGGLAVPSEGAVALLLERPDAARARGAEPVAVLQGVGILPGGGVAPADAVVLAMWEGLVNLAPTPRRLFWGGDAPSWAETASRRDHALGSGGVSPGAIEPLGPAARVAGGLAGIAIAALTCPPGGLGIQEYRRASSPRVASPCLIGIAGLGGGVAWASLEVT